MDQCRGYGARMLRLERLLSFGDLDVKRMHSEAADWPTSFPSFQSREGVEDVEDTRFICFGLPTETNPNSCGTRSHLCLNLGIIYHGLVSGVA